MIGIPEKLNELVNLSEVNHACGVAQLAREAARPLGVSPDLAYLAGLLHDVGKVLWPRELLLHPGSMTAEWREMMAEHPVRGASLVEEHWPYVSPDVLHAVKHHHERLDGHGYPEGLRHLPRLTMVIAAADVLDALRRDRPNFAACELSVAAGLLRQEALEPSVIEQVISAAVRVQALSQEWPAAVAFR